jgi:hypothetical protein
MRLFVLVCVLAAGVAAQEPLPYVDTFLGTGRSAAKEYIPGGAGGNHIPGRVALSPGRVYFTPKRKSMPVPSLSEMRYA